MSAGVARLGPSIIRRQGLEHWLKRFSSVPVRFLVAPPGFGKTMALLGYLRHASSRGRYCPVPAGSTSESVWDALRRALHVEQDIRCERDLLAVLGRLAPLELALDCQDVPEASGIATILKLVEDLPDDVSVLIACRSRAAFQVGRFVSQGSAVLCDAERLAFDAAAIRHVAETLSVPFTHRDVLRMLETTDGWPQVVSGALRKAAEDSCSMAEALEHWRLRHGHLFNEFVADALAHVSEHDADLVLKLMSGS
ncbi:MAG: hypothetical protein JO104_04620, partial [Candidatus Eremiobacteraeota bacterium]|nr:hypothetical protein [Candidatus Eremiobacteraeota bacterium]